MEIKIWKWKIDLNNLKKIKRLNEFSLLYIPEGTSVTAKSKKLKASTFFLIFFFYSFFIFLLSFMIFSFTPVNNLLFTKTGALTSDEQAQLNNLNDKIIFLTKELENLKSVNERLRYSIILGDSTFKESFEKKDTVSKKEKIKPAGNIYFIFSKLIEKYFDDNKLFFIAPSSGFISRGFNASNGHFGIDYVLKTGTPVFASANGYVVFSDYTVKDGYMIIINHFNEYITVYKHCSSLIKKVREFVIQGEPIALSGNSGQTTTGPHLHFELWQNGVPLDPQKYFINN